MQKKKLQTTTKNYMQNILSFFNTQYINDQNFPSIKTSHFHTYTKQKYRDIKIHFSNQIHWIVHLNFCVMCDPIQSYEALNVVNNDSLQNETYRIYASIMRPGVSCDP